MKTLVSSTGEPIKEAIGKEEESNYTGNLPKPPQETAISVEAPLYDSTMSIKETVDMSEVRNLLPGPNIVLVQERDLREYAVKSSAGTVFNAKNEEAKGTVVATIVAVNPDCKPWIKENCLPGRNVLIRTMSGNFLSPNGTKHTFIYEQDIIGLCTVDQE